MSFIKKSLEELDHVVWPTNAESKKYMLYTVGTIIIMATLLSLVGYGIRFGLKGVRDIFPHDAVVSSTVSGESTVNEQDMENLKNEIERRKNALSGAKVEVNPVSSSSPEKTELSVSGANK
ncbi:MAG: hypothetical protein HHAS10_08990 [Candidatus Altimarinota bacterium]